MTGTPNIRLLAKTVSWSVLATLVTAFVAYKMTGSVSVAGAVALVDRAVKLIAYYLHELIWGNYGDR